MANVKKRHLLLCCILFWTPLGYATAIASIVLTCSFLAAASILGFFVSYFKQMVHRMIFIILIHDDIK